MSLMVDEVKCEESVVQPHVGSYLIWHAVLNPKCRCALRGLLDLQLLDLLLLRPPTTADHLTRPRRFVDSFHCPHPPPPTLCALEYTEETSGHMETDCAQSVENGRADGRRA